MESSSSAKDGIGKNLSALFKPLALLLNNNKAKVGFGILVALIVLSVAGLFVSPYNPNADIFATGQPPSSSHLLGTTSYGQDVFSQLLVGAGPTLMVGLVVGVLGTLISVVVGVASGFASDRVNGIINSVVNIFLIVPGILLIMLFGTFFLGIHQSLGYLPIIIILVITGWAFGARTFRSVTMSVGKRDFILSSILIGESRMSIIFRQIIRSIFPIIVSNFFFTAMYGTMGLTFVEYLGVGNLLQINWGTMLYWAINNEAYLTGLWWWILPPSIMISVLMFSFTLLNFGMDEVANPSLRRFKPVKDKPKSQELTRGTGE